MDLLEESIEFLSEAVEDLTEKKKSKKKGKPFSRKIGDDTFKLDKLGYVGKWREIAHHNAFIAEPGGRILFLPGQMVKPKGSEKETVDKPEPKTAKKGIFARIRHALSKIRRKK